MDRVKARLVGERVTEHLKSLENELGVTFSRGSGSFDSATLSFKLNITENAPDGRAVTKEERDFESHAVVFGLKKSDLGKVIVVGGKQMEIVGCKPRNRKYPIIANEVGTGRSYKLSETQVKLGLG